MSPDYIISRPSIEIAAQLSFRFARKTRRKLLPHFNDLTKILSRRDNIFKKSRLNRDDYTKLLSTGNFDLNISPIQRRVTPVRGRGDGCTIRPTKSVRDTAKRFTGGGHGYKKWQPLHTTIDWFYTHVLSYIICLRARLRHKRIITRVLTRYSVGIFERNDLVRRILIMYTRVVCYNSTGRYIIGTRAQTREVRRV